MEIYTLTPPGPATLHKLKVFNIIYVFLERHKAVVGSSGGHYTPCLANTD